MLCIIGVDTILSGFGGRIFLIVTFTWENFEDFFFRYCLLNNFFDQFSNTYFLR